MKSQGPKKTPIRISHYGCGKGAKSPVIITLPEELGGDRFVANAEFADCLYDAYESVHSASEFQEFKTSLNYLRNMVIGGHYGSLEGALRECVQTWRSRNTCGYFEPVRRTDEEQAQDVLGELAAWAEIETPISSRSSIYQEWHNARRVPTVRRIAIDATVLLASLSAIAYLAVSSGEWSWFMALFLLPLFLRFSTTVENAMVVSPFHWRAYQLYPGESDGDKTAFMRSMVAGATNEEIYCRIRDRLETERLGKKSERLAETIAHELATQEELLALEAANVAPINSLFGLGMEASESPLETTIAAQRALLDELRARNLELQH